MGEKPHARDTRKEAEETEEEPPPARQAASKSSAAGGKSATTAAILLHVPRRFVTAVVHCQQMFRRRRQERGKKKRRSKHEQRELELWKDRLLPRAEKARERRNNRRRRYLVDAIGRLTKRWGTGKNVWLTMDRLLQASKKGADVNATADIMRGFWAQQLVRKLVRLGDEMVTLAALEIDDRIQMDLWGEIEKCSTTVDKEQIKFRIMRWMGNTGGNNREV